MWVPVSSTGKVFDGCTIGWNSLKKKKKLANKTILYDYGNYHSETHGKYYLC